MEPGAIILAIVVAIGLKKRRVRSRGSGQTG